MKKILPSLLAVLAVTLALAMALAGCGSRDSATMNFSASSSAAMAPRPEAAPQENSFAMDQGTSGQAEGGSAGFVLPQDRKIVRNSRLELETQEFDKALEQLGQIIAKAGGYVESQSQSGTSVRDKSRYQERSASISARIPAEKLDEVTRSVGGLCNVLSKSESMDDITDSYYDSQARLDSLKIQEERLLEILKKAEKLEDVITLESALSQVRYEIESLTAALKRMDGQVAYSYLNMELREVVEYSQIQEKPKTFGEKLGDSFARGVSDMVAGCQSLVLFLAEAGPSLLVWAAVILAVALPVRRFAKKKAARRAAQGLPMGAPRPSGTTNPQPAQPSAFERYPKPQEPKEPKEPKE